jgi:CubicO group peptidase (beta-lactamase class C family)
VRRISLVIAVLAVVATSTAVPASAQSLPVSFFERYLDALREQYAIPGLSYAVIQGGTAQARGLGKRDVEANLNAEDTTPYYVGNLSQIFGSTLLLQKCMDDNTLELTDRVTRWVPFPEPETTVGQLLAHQSPVSGAYAYDTARFASLTQVVEECADLPYRHILADTFRELRMPRSVPGRNLDGIAQPGSAVFTAGERAFYADLITQMASPYRLDRGRLVKSTVPVVPADAATGVITSVSDLVTFDNALASGLLLSPSSLRLAWTQETAATGLGWFVQNYKNEAMVWQFDSTPGVGSSMIVKLPARGLTLILLANSDGLAAPFGLTNGDALASPFVQLFLKVFVP